jgi:hypothetical protein
VIELTAREPGKLTPNLGAYSRVAAAVALLAAGYGLTSADDVDDDFVAAKLKPVPPAQFPCARFAPGSIVQNPPDLFSTKGKLVVDLFPRTSRPDSIGITRTSMGWRITH